MIYSFDIGTKNFAIYIEDENNNPYFIDNVDLTPYSCKNLYIYLKPIFLKFPVKTALIEKQVFANKKASMVSYNLEAIIFMQFPESNVYFINPKNKTFLKDVKGCTYKMRKLASVESASNYLENNFLLEKLNSFKKKDDICDAICQLMFYKNNKTKLV